MLFNSHAFIFIFLPVVLAGYFQLGRINNSYAAAWLGMASIFFYGYWNAVYLGLLLCSIAFNYVFGFVIARVGDRNVDDRRRKWLLICAIAANLLLLAYYKYANFFIDNINNIAEVNWNVGAVLLPLGISFFTFTQIAYLVDTYQLKVKEHNLIHYILFVTYFPHLIAGPVLHHKEMMPQFALASTFRFSYINVAVGSTIFFIGLFKKVMLADGISEYVGPAFSAPALGLQLTFNEAWSGALCYTLQLYFDFSGYSDMAIGLSRMFGVVLPLNFHSPYKSVNIIEFWRRWHMTLSRFLRDYLYIPLGGSRKGKTRRYLNLIITMLLGGLWHGAGWTFIIWGGFHGILLAANHAWHGFRRWLGHQPNHSLPTSLHAVSVLFTFLLVTVAWVFFRAENVDTALAIVKAMLGGNGLGGSNHLVNDVLTRNRILIVMLAMVWLAPNTQQIMHRYKPVLDAQFTMESKYAWSLAPVWLMVTLTIAIPSIISISKLSEFLYFQF